MKIRFKFVFGLIGNVLRKLRYGERLEFNIFNVFIHPTTRIEISGSGKIKFAAGRRIYIDRGGLIRSSGGVIEIGAGFFMNQNCMIVSHENISIGSEVMFGPGVCVFDSDHSMQLDGRPFSSQGYKKSPVKLADNVWVGANAVLTRGCSVGANTVVAANSVAKGELEAASVYAGVPAKKVKSLVS